MTKREWQIEMANKFAKRNNVKELTDEEIKSEAKYFCYSWHSQNPERLVLFARAILRKAQDENSQIYAAFDKAYEEHKRTAPTQWAIERGTDAAEEIMIDYLLLKVQQKDWHGVSDAANDLREMNVKKEKNT